jgi:hypothetical protein
MAASSRRRTSTTKSQKASRSAKRLLCRLAGVVLSAAVAACSDQTTDHLKSTTKPTYDRTTGKLKELTYDSNLNGRIDTWTEMDGARPLRSRIDRDEDGTIDRWEYYDQNGQITKVGFSRHGGDRPDAWAYSSPSGQLERVEASSTADETKIDRWEFYDTSAATSRPGGLVRAADDTNRDGKPDKWVTYAGGLLETAEFDENSDGRPDRRLTYRSSALVLIESEPGVSGSYTRRIAVKP